MTSKKEQRVKYQTITIQRPFDKYLRIVKMVIGHYVIPY